MAEALTASFRLTLEDQLSNPLQKLMDKLNRLQAVVGGVKATALDELQKRLQGAAGGADQMTRAAERTQSAVRGIGAGARAMGTEFRAATDQASAGLDSLQAKMRAISAADIRRGVLNAAAPSSSINARPTPPPSAIAGFRGSLNHFQEATENAGGRAFGAAMTGFGLVEPVERFAELDKQIRGQAIDLGVPMNHLDAYVTQQRMRDYQIALSTGQSSREVAGAAHYLALSGLNQTTITRMMPAIARVAATYGADMSDVAATGFHAYESLGIGPRQLEMALAHTAHAGTMGHVGFAEMAQLIPGLMTQAGPHYQGQKGLDKLLTYFVLARRGAATAGEAATNLSSFLTHIFEPVNVKSFARDGIDLPKLLTNAQKTGIDPVFAVLTRVRGLIQGKDATQQSLILGKLFGRKEEAQFAQTLLKQYDEIAKFQAKLGGVGQSEIQGNFDKQMQGASAVMGRLKEQVDELSDRFAVGFVPVLRVVSGGIGLMVSGMNLLDHLMPGASSGVITVMGSLLALATVLGVIGAVAPVVGRGFQVLVATMRLVRVAAVGLGGPVVALGLVLVAAAADIILHWSRFQRFFVQMFDGLRKIFHGNVLAGLGEMFAGEFGLVRQLFVDLMHWIDGWTHGLGSSILRGITTGWAVLVGGFDALLRQLESPFQNLEREFAGSMLGHLIGLGSGTAGGPTTHRLEVHVTADPGVSVATRSATPGVSVSGASPARGPMTTRR